MLAGRLNDKLDEREKTDTMNKLTSLAKQHYKKNYQEILNDIVSLKWINASREYHQKVKLFIQSGGNNSSPFITKMQTSKNALPTTD